MSIDLVVKYRPLIDLPIDESFFYQGYKSICTFHYSVPSESIIKAIVQNYCRETGNDFNRIVYTLL